MFEILKTDLAGRIGKLHTNHGTVETPAYVPVVHPAKHDISSDTLKEMGFQMIITNAYITMKRHGEDAIRRGIHDIVNYDGPIMTDSGGYQVLEYGDLNITPPQMAQYETDIMSDIPVPLDKPTGFGLSHRQAAAYVTRTLKASQETIKAAAPNGQIWAGPIQGGEHLDLVRRSARSLVKQGYTFMALGSPVEFMESYEYSHLARIINAARTSIPYGIPLHLFGAGHPITIPMAVALGCDTFDSASYILYAKQDRYITPDGTRYLSDMYTLPCSCRICASYTASELRNEKRDARTNLLALHNLYAIKLEVDATRQALHEGRLWEYVTKKARAHPKLYDAIPILALESILDAGTPIFKSKAAFFFDVWDQYRPEAATLRRALKRYTTKKRTLHIVSRPRTSPAYLSINDTDPDVLVCIYTPHLGLIPLDLSDLYPAAHHLDSNIHRNPQDYPTFGDSWDDFIRNHNINHIIYDRTDPFISYFVNKTAVPSSTLEK